MLAYRYDSNKIYIGTVECQLDPLETKYVGHDVYLLPADSTFEQPPEEKQGYNIVWNGNAWEYEEIPMPPEPTEEEKKESVRLVRNAYLSDTDYTQLSDSPFTSEEKQEYANYRQYLRDYTNGENWWEQNPKTFNEWKA